MDIFNSVGSSSFEIKGFAILYFATFIPCWVTLFLAVRAIFKRQLSLFIAWSIALLALLFLPYGFVLATSSLNIWQLWALIIIITLFSYYKLFFSKKTLSVDWFWDWYAKNYDTLLYFEPYKELILEISKKVTEHSNQRIKVLEIGCGTGNIASQLSNHNNIEYLGLDSSTEMLERARKKFKDRKNFSFENKAVENELSNLNSTFDVIIVNNVLYALQDHEVVVGLIRKVINPDGRFIVSEPLRNSSIGYLVRQSFKKNKLKSFFQFVIRLPAFIFLLVANLMILEIEHIKKKNFFNQDELEKLLLNKGFEIDHTKNVYEKQNIMLVAIPA